MAKLVLGEMTFQIRVCHLCPLNYLIYGSQNVLKSLIKSHSLKSLMFSLHATQKHMFRAHIMTLIQVFTIIQRTCSQTSEVEFVHPVTAGGSVKFLPAV